MKHFTIESDNNITVHGSAKQADSVQDSERFGNEAALAKLAANWPSARLVEIWNSLPGATEVKKFKDRPTAVSRIWKAIQTLGAEPVATAEAAPEAAPFADQPIDMDQREARTATDVGAQTPDVAPEAVSAKVKAARRKKAVKTAADAGTPREGSKTSQVIAMLKREGGTTLEEIMGAMGWLKHTTRAILSAGGSLTKKHGVVIVSEKIDGKRVYSIKG